MTTGPDFLIIGAPETAATFLHAALARHPQVHVLSSTQPREAGQLVGDLEPHLLSDAAAQDGLRLDGVKLVSVVRDPVDRAFASWTRRRDEGQETEADFVRAVQDPARDYRTLGLYGEQLTHLLSRVEPRQNLVLRHRDVRDHPALSINRTCELLGIDTDLVAVHQGTEHRTRPKPTAEQRAALLPLFEQDIATLARLVGQEFGEWLEDRSAAGLPA